MLIAETPRLRIRKYTPADAAFILELLNSPPFLQNVGDRKIRDLAAAEAYLQKGALADYAQRGYGSYLVEHRADKQPIGRCGFIKRDFLEAVDIGFAFLPGYLGQGYGSEAAQAVLDYGLATYGLRDIMGIVQPTNQASIALLQKLGLRFERTFTFPEEETPMHLYRLKIL